MLLDSTRVPAGIIRSMCDFVPLTINQFEVFRPDRFYSRFYLTSLAATHLGLDQLNALSSLSFRPLATYTERSAVLTWSAVSMASGYNLYYAEQGLDPLTQGSQAQGVSSPYTLAGLNPTGNYSFLITAILPGGEDSGRVPLVSYSQVTHKNSPLSVDCLDTTALATFFIGMNRNA